MPSISKCTLLLVLSVLWSATVLADKHALIITIGDYPTEGLWPDISSHNDVAHIEAALLHIGFNRQQITYLSDEDATRQGIESQLKFLLARTKTGDMVYIHYSGHGQQVVDDNGDEIDNLDEAIVPYDSPMLFEKGIYEGERLLRDDVIGSLTRSIRAKCGPTGQLVLVMDSCHSGTGTRGLGRARGTDRLMAPPAFKVEIKTAEKDEGIVVPGKDLAPMASYYGASPRELNYETTDETAQSVGSLSFAFSKVLTSATRAMTFRELFERLSLKMKVYAPRQNPQWEGPENVVLFGGATGSNKDYFTIKEVLSEQLLVINGGTIDQLYKGSTVQITDPEDGAIVATGLITTEGLTASVITVDKPITKGYYYQVEIKDRSYPQIIITVHATEDTEEHWPELNSILTDLPIVRLTTHTAEVFISICDGNSLQLATKEGDILQIISLPSGSASENRQAVTERLRSYAQGKYLKTLEGEVPGYDFSVILIRQDCKTNRPLTSSQPADISLKVGACVQFEVTNNGIKGAYFSLIDIQPDNVVNVIAPAVFLGHTADEYFLKPGETYTTNYPIEIGQPYGEETVKLLASSSPLDLSAVMRTEGKSTRGLATPSALEQVFADSYQLHNSQRTQTKNVTAQRLATKTLHFKIVD